LEQAKKQIADFEVKLADEIKLHTSHKDEHS